jgi:glycosyltransferase involved in cell wall biosynthesis
LQVWWQLRNAGIPVVANYQTDLASYSRRMLPILLNNSAAWLIDRVTSLLKQDCFKFILVPSGSARAYLSSLGVKEERMRLVGRGVDGTVFNPAFRSEELRHTLAPNGEVLLLCVSRVSLEKGFDFLADAYALMVKLAKERGLKTPFRLVVTGGNTNQGIENAIKSYFEKQSLDVVFTGPRTGNPLSEVYASADIFVFPSLTETFGQVIQEAMSSGLPVVARREGGPADIVEEGETGFLINPSDATDFAEKTLRLVEDAGLRREMSEKALRFACSRSWDAINQQIARIMVEAL